MTAPSTTDAGILIVDDQEANLRLLERILEWGGYRRRLSIGDSRQALAAFQEFQPDLVLLDLMMPFLDGVGVIEQLRPLTAGDYLPILVLTADGTSEAKRRALNAGAKDFLTKPLDAVEVLLRIKNLLETRGPTSASRNKPRFWTAPATPSWSWIPTIASVTGTRERSGFTAGKRPKPWAATALSCCTRTADRPRRCRPT
jgi:DNA-binding response OmpR family regulator